MAIAAAVIGLIVTAWVFINNRKDNTQIASAPDVKQNVSIPDQITDTNLKSNTDEKIIPEIISSANQNIPAQPFNKLIVSPSKIKKERTQTLPVLLSINTNKTLNDEKTGEKIFTGPIDDLSLIAANDNYFTMVNSNGRMVKIPAHLAHLAPRLQDKPITEDYYEILYGEGAYWKDKVSEWRKRLADSPATSGDMFSNAVELLKSAQNN